MNVFVNIPRDSGGVNRIGGSQFIVTFDEPEIKTILEIVIESVRLARPRE